MWHAWNVCTFGRDFICLDTFDVLHYIVSARFILVRVNIQLVHFKIWVGGGEHTSYKNVEETRPLITGVVNGAFMNVFGRCTYSVSPLCMFSFYEHCFVQLFIGNFRACAVRVVALTPRLTYICMKIKCWYTSVRQGRVDNVRWYDMTWLLFTLIVALAMIPRLFDIGHYIAPCRCNNVQDVLVTKSPCNDYDLTIFCKHKLGAYYFRLSPSCQVLLQLA